MIFIRKLNPIIIGWVNYQKYNVSSKAFEKLDYEKYKCLWDWCIRRHPKKGTKWIAKKYFHTIGNRTWTFSVATGDRMENGEKYYLRLKYATDTDIKRFTKIQAEANPFDENWQIYFEEREELKIRNELKGRTIINKLYKTQNGICPVCGEKITMDTDIDIIEQDETLDIAGDALEGLPKDIIEANSTDVDAYSGATNTSNGIKEAVKKAIDEASDGSTSKDNPNDDTDADSNASEDWEEE
ncbi:fumarate reductase [Lactobacillus ginsenosidimutans] [Dolosigranulum pigrum]|nr:FMN-binding protein [Dolosigranulum pigrum]QTJ36368.1 FMN-binding protein [Dolosigranulum pigrum]VTU62089.1 fumarate reductase [Lactobacillus ginsenosidimutans] [Dolosigranulum pigrum]